MYYAQAADDVPKLVHAIVERLSLPEESQKSPLAYFLTAKEFEKWVAEEVDIKLSDDEKKVAIEYLDSSGIVSNFYLKLFKIVSSFLLFLRTCRSLIWVVEFAFVRSGFVTT